MEEIDELIDDLLPYFLNIEKVTHLKLGVIIPTMSEQLCHYLVDYVAIVKQFHAVFLQYIIISKHH